MPQLVSIITSVVLVTGAFPASGQDLPHLLGDVSPTVPASDALVTAATDGSSGAFLAGHRNVGGNDDRALLVHVDSTGTADLDVEFGATSPAGPGGQTSTRVLTIEADGSGGVFVAGLVSGSGFAGPPQGGQDGFVAHLDPQGSVLWATRLADAGAEFVTDLCPDGSGGVFAVGSALGGALGGPGQAGFSDTFVAQVDAVGAIVFVSRYSQPGESVRFSSVTPDGVGGAICGGRARQQNPAYDTVLTARYDASGGLLWAFDDNNVDFSGKLVAADGAGGFFLGGQGYVAAAPDAGLVERRDSAGQVIWSRTVGLCGTMFCSGVTTVDALMVDASGDVLVAGSTGGLVQAYVARFSPQGSLEGYHVLDPGPLFRTSLYFAAALDPAGRLLAFGDRQRVSDFVRIPLLARYAWTALGASLGASACPAVPNSSGVVGHLRAVGSDLASENAVTLWTSDLPSDVIGIFLASRTSGFAAFPGGSAGNLCLGGSIGRFNRPGEVLFSGLQGGFDLDVDLTDFPSPTGSVSALAGETWFFQAWHRDTGTMPTSQFTDALEVTLR